MSRFTAEVTQVGFDVNTGKRYCVAYFICDTFADLPSKTEYTDDNIILMIGTRATVIDPASEYRMKEDGTWCIDTVKNNTYSKDEIDAMINAINDTDDDQDIEITNLQTQNTNQQQEIDYSINTGAKNIVINTADASRTVLGITWTKNDDGSMQATGTATGNSAVRIVGVQGSSTYASAVPIPPGTYTVSASGFELERYRFVLGLFDDENSSRTTKNIYNEEYTFTVSTYTARFDFSCLILNGYDAPAGTWYPMIRDSVISSKTYEPYAPTNRELYEMILQLQQTTGLRTMSLTRNIIPNEEITLDEEVPEEEER